MNHELYRSFSALVCAIDCKVRRAHGHEPEADLLGPVTTERAVLGGKRVLNSYFLLLPTGGDPIKLEYLDKVQAVEARTQLLTSPGTHRVASTKLLRRSTRRSRR